GATGAGLAAGGGTVISLPAAISEAEITRLEPRMARFHDLADGAPDHDLPQLDRRGVRLRIVHAPPHVRIEREPDRATEDLAVGGGGERRPGDLGEGGVWVAGGVGPGQHGGVGGGVGAGLLPAGVVVRGAPPS